MKTTKTLKPVVKPIGSTLKALKPVAKKIGCKQGAVLSKTTRRLASSAPRAPRAPPGMVRFIGFIGSIGFIGFIIGLIGFIGSIGFIQGPGIRHVVVSGSTQVKVAQSRRFQISRPHPTCSRIFRQAQLCLFRVYGCPVLPCSCSKCLGKASYRRSSWAHNDCTGRELLKTTWTPKVCRIIALW